MHQVSVLSLEPQLPAPLGVVLMTFALMSVSTSFAPQAWFFPPVWGFRAAIPSSGRVTHSRAVTRVTSVTRAATAPGDFRRDTSGVPGVIGTSPPVRASSPHAPSAVTILCRPQLHTILHEARRSGEKVHRFFNRVIAFRWPPLNVVASRLLTAGSKSSKTVACLLLPVMRALRPASVAYSELRSRCPAIAPATSLHLPLTYSSPEGNQ